MTELRFITNTTAAVTETIYDGKPYLIAPVVMIREGIMNGLLYLADEYVKNATSWQGRPVSLGHPQRNGEYVSANSPDIWANEVPGQLWNVTADATGLKGEIWIDLDKADKIGEPALAVVESLRANQPVEVSTGLFADVEETAGVWTNGASYEGIARNICPDHLALLPNEIGACSWDDGCGTPRVNQKGEQMQVNELTLEDRASLVRRAFWQGIASDPMSDPYDLDVIAIFDAVVIAKDWSKKTHIAYNYTIDETGNVTIGAPSPVDVVYRAKEGGAEAVVANQDGKQQGILARLGGLFKRDKTDSVDNVAVNQQEEENVKRCDVVAAITANKQVKLSKEQLDKLDDATLQALHDSIQTNEEAATAPANEATVPAPVELPQEVLDFAKMIQGLGGVEKLGSALQGITANADNERAALVAELVANEQCQFDEGELKAMPVAQLQKLASMLQVRDYSGGVGVIVPNGGADKDHVLEMPKPAEWLVGKEAK